MGAPERTLIKPYLKYRRTRAAANLNSGAAEFPRAARAARRGAARAGGVGLGWVGWGGVGRVCVFARVRACVRPPLCVCACACVCARVGARARDEAFESAALTCTERQSFPLLCVNVVGGEYDFAHAKPLLTALQDKLPITEIATLRTELRDCGYSVGKLSCSLIHAIPNAISDFFAPAAGDAMMDAAVNDIILKLGRKAELLKSHAIGTQSAIDGESSKARQGWQAGAAKIALSTGLDRRRSR